LDRFQTGAVPYSTNERTRLLIQFIAEVTARYNASVTKILRAVNRRKQRIPDMDEQDTVDFAAHEVALNSFLDALVPQASVLAKIVTGKTIPITEDEREAAEDAMLSTTQLIDLSRSILETVRSIREAHNTISTQQLNKVIRQLTALTVLVTIPNVITGFYGMNIALPGADSPFAAGAIILTIGILLGVTAMLFVRNKWF
jgi:magnesium transporter